MDIDETLKGEDYHPPYGTTDKKQNLRKCRAFQLTYGDANSSRKDEDIDVAETEYKDDDIFLYIKELLKSMPRDHVKITWMPAHLDEDKTKPTDISSFFSRKGD